MYAIEGGRVHEATPRGVRGFARIGHFGYGHIETMVEAGEVVRAGQPIGWTWQGGWHVHLSEFVFTVDGRRLIVNPPRRGGKIFPYVDRVKPVVHDIRFYAPATPRWGRRPANVALLRRQVRLNRARLSGRVDIRVRASDPQSFIGWFKQIPPGRRTTRSGCRSRSSRLQRAGCAPARRVLGGAAARDAGRTALRARDRAEPPGQRMHALPPHGRVRRHLLVRACSAPVLGHDAAAERALLPPGPGLGHRTQHDEGRPPADDPELIAVSDGIKRLNIRYRAQPAHAPCRRSAARALRAGAADAAAAARDLAARPERARRHQRQQVERPAGARELRGRLPRRHGTPAAPSLLGVARADRRPLPHAADRPLSPALAPGGRAAIYAVGGSMGGHETLLLLGQYPKLLDGAVAFDSVTNFYLRYHDFARSPGGRAAQAFAHRGRRHAADESPRLRPPQSHALASGDRPVRCPLQLWWSEADKIVIDQAKQSGAFYRELGNGGRAGASRRSPARGATRSRATRRSSFRAPRWLGLVR